MKAIKNKLSHLTALEKMILIYGDILAIYNLYINPGAFILTALLLMLTSMYVLIADIQEEYE